MRDALNYLSTWIQERNRKPLVMRGARQVGKTTLVRQLAQFSKKTLIEINFEHNPQLLNYFASNDPKEVLTLLEAKFNQQIDIANSILFLDEIQAAPILLSKLRWFAEDLADLAVVAAGSLLDFTLADHEFSMPVGRITYMYVSPLTFEEFLDASNKPVLLEYLKKYKLNDNIPLPLHKQFLDIFKEYLIVGGMPAASFSWANERSLEKVSRIHHDLLGSFRDDFAKYAKRLPLERLEDVINAVPSMLGNKFIFSRVNKNAQAVSIKNALDLLCKARIVIKVLATAANGIPLGAEVNDKFFKTIFLDVGLVSAMLNLRFDQVIQIEDINLINSGGITEQVVGQILQALPPFYVSNQLFYWMREQKNSNAELDYIIQNGTEIIPIEVKSGSKGTLRSLHLFMHLKKLNWAIRINQMPPSVTTVETVIHDKLIKYKLLSLPFYLIGQLPRVLNERS